MDFVDWRKRQDRPSHELPEDQQHTGRIRGRMGDYIEEMIRKAQARGDFDNLAGVGKPLQFEPDPDAGDNTMAYKILKDSGHIPAEIELQHQIDADLARANAKVERLKHHYHALRRRRVLPFERDKRAFNVQREKAITEYDEALRRINSKILTLNISTPPAMHRPLLQVGQLVEQLREDCPPFA